MSDLIAVDPGSTRQEIEDQLNDTVAAIWEISQENMVITIPEVGPNEGRLVAFPVPGIQAPPENGIRVATFDAALDGDQVAAELAKLEESENLVTRFYGKTTVANSPQPQWLAVLDRQGAPPAAAQAPTAPPAGGIATITGIAAGSAIATYHWKTQGVAPIGYIKGMAVSFARVYCKLKTGNNAFANEMAKANTGKPISDTLAYYADEFRAQGMDNSASGADTLRHLFVFLTGEGMLESSGYYFEGKYKGQNNTGANTAEAGAFQTSYDARGANPLMRQLFLQYSQNPDGFIDIFKEGCPKPDADNLKNWGVGEGVLYQALAKSSPAFAAEFTALALRNTSQAWSTVIDKRVEIRPECDAMFRQVQAAVDANNLCPV